MTNFKEKAMAQTIGIFGGTGFVGRHLSPLLLEAGHQVIVFTRGETKKENGIQFAHWNAASKEIDAAALALCTTVVNLSGAGVADHRWTAEYKKKIEDSRVAATLFLQEQLKINAPNCKAFIAASATGYYGSDEDGSPPFTETSPASNDYLGRICQQWENASLQERKRIRSVVFRFGIVLGKESGAYPKLSQPTNFGIVPLLGGGHQMVSWITVSDLARLLFSAIHEVEYDGIYNAVAPDPVSNKVLMQQIAKVKGGIKIPVPVPGFVLQLIMGEASVEVLKSTTVSAQKLVDAGFSFLYPDISSAVRHVENS